MQVLIWAMLLTTWWTYASRMTFYYLQILALRWHKFWRNSWRRWVRLVYGWVSTKRSYWQMRRSRQVRLWQRTVWFLKVLERHQGQKWLGCILTASGSMMQHLDLPPLTTWNKVRNLCTQTVGYCRTRQFQYIRGWNISMLACQQWFVLEVATVHCTRNNFIHLTSFFGNFVGQL